MSNPAPFLLLLLLTGCHFTWVRSVTLDVHLTNDSNELLVIEGRCNLPDGAILEARLGDRGRPWSQGRGRLHQGRYAVVLDISRCPGFRPLDLEIFFDPLSASAQVQRFTGARGEALAGDLLVESHDRVLVLQRQRLVLTMSRRQLTLRRWVAGQANIEELQSYLVRHPRDANSLLGLGLALLKQRPSQQTVDSEAYKVLREGLLYRPRAQALEMEARLCLARLDEKAARLAAERQRERQRLEQPTFHPSYRENLLIRPTLALGAFELGMGRQFLLLSFRLQPSEGPGCFSLAEFPRLNLTFDADQRLVSIATDDPRYRTFEGLGVGSSLQDLQRLIPGLEVAFSPPEVKEDGRAHQYCKLELEGLNLWLEQSYHPEYPFPEQEITKIEVVPGSRAKN